MRVYVASKLGSMLIVRCGSGRSVALRMKCGYMWKIKYRWILVGVGGRYILN